MLVRSSCFSIAKGYRFIIVFFLYESQTTNAAAKGQFKHRPMIREIWNEMRVYYMCVCVLDVCACFEPVPLLGEVVSGATRQHAVKWICNCERYWCKMQIFFYLNTFSRSKWNWKLCVSVRHRATVYNTYIPGEMVHCAQTSKHIPSVMATMSCHKTPGWLRYLWIMNLMTFVSDYIFCRKTELNGFRQAIRSQKKSLIYSGW